MSMRRVLLLLWLLATVAGSRSWAAVRDAAFQVVVVHDVVDTRSALDPDSISTTDLVSFLEWLRAHQWNFISLDDVEQARKGESPLPQRAILITVDDGYLSEYTRVFPLLLAYKVPAVMALVGSWMDGTASSGRPQITWEQAREMQRSGLVEFASHSYDMHHGMIGNPQGNVLPPAAFRKYEPGVGYESEAAYRERIRADLMHSAQQMKKELGRSPRSLAWPYGRYTEEAEEIASEVGFAFTFTLDPEPAFLDKSIGIGRHYITTNDVVDAQRRLFQSVLPPVQRLVHVNPADLWNADADQADTRLGKAIERVRELGATAVVVDAVEEDSTGKITRAWFPNSQLSLSADWFLRVCQQLRARAGVAVYGRMPVQKTLKAMNGNADRVLALFREMGIHGAIDGILLENAPTLARIETEPNDSGGAPWQVRRRRDAVDDSKLSPLDSLTLRCFHAVEAERSGLKLALANPIANNPGPSSIADISLVLALDQPKEVAKLQKEMHTLGWFQPMFARRFGLWIESSVPPAPGHLATITRRFEREGGAVIGWGTDDPIGNKPPAALVAPSVSASTFPVRF
jgi:poly-beta-1,6-N-acetyl-D-glucosamine N-deacetylase